VQRSVRLTMSTESNITLIPLQAPVSWLRYAQAALFASDESNASGTQDRAPDRILIIEDDLLIAAQIETTLTEAGFVVIAVAPTGEEAIELAANDPPGLAVVDIRLAGDKDGVDTALELFRLHGTRCIFASAYSDHEARRRAEPAAPLGWLQKPYTMASLTEMVRAALSELRSRRD
jgi:two-component system, response regulator PdtaR